MLWCASLSLSSSLAPACLTGQQQHIRNTLATPPSSTHPPHTHSLSLCQTYMSGWTFRNLFWVTTLLQVVWDKHFHTFTRSHPLYTHTWALVQTRVWGCVWVWCVWVVIYQSFFFWRRRSSLRMKSCLIAMTFSIDKHIWELVKRAIGGQEFLKLQIHVKISGNGKWTLIIVVHSRKLTWNSCFGTVSETCFPPVSPFGLLSALKSLGFYVLSSFFFFSCLVFPFSFL
jgi:hypothetical protein